MKALRKPALRFEPNPPHDEAEIYGSSLAYKKNESLVMKFTGMRVLDDRDYKAFLLRKYNISMSPELNCYVSDQRSFDNQDDALSWADEQERDSAKLALKKKASLKAEKKKKYILIVVGIVVAFLVVRTAGRLIVNNETESEITQHNIEVLQSRIDRVNQSESRRPN